MNEYIHTHIHMYIHACMYTFVCIYINTSEDLAKPALKPRKSQSEWSDIMHFCSTLTTCRLRIMNSEMIT